MEGPGLLGMGLPLLLMTLATNLPMVILPNTRSAKRFFGVRS